jgi:hypothetical protein
MKMTHDRNDLAPLSDFVVTETIIKRTRRQVSLYDWDGYLTTPLSINWDRLVIVFYADEPRDVEVIPPADMIVDGWKIEWFVA